jgi:hypothetical protein
MTVPPDYGGLDFEEGAQEDLGAPLDRHRDPLDQDQGGRAADDNEAQAPGQVCELCGSVITPGQDVRRRADGQWMHEVCPPDLTGLAAPETSPKDRLS